jgi:hypothetical protein
VGRCIERFGTQGTAEMKDFLYITAIVLVCGITTAILAVSLIAIVKYLIVSLITAL